MKAMHDVLREVDIIDASEGLTVLIEHDGQTKEVLRRAVVPLPAAELARREQAQAPQHTPGPWGVGYGEDRVITIGPYPCVVADCAPNNELSLEEVAANAALIARAPELLAENARLRSLLAELTEAASRHVICMNFNLPSRGLTQEEWASREELRVAIAAAKESV